MVFASLSVAGLLLGFGFVRASENRSQVLATHTYAAPRAPGGKPLPTRRAVRVRPSFERATVTPRPLHLAHPMRPSAPKGTASRAPRRDAAPNAPGEAPILDIPTPPEVPDPVIPGSDGPDPCVTDPPDSLDSCLDRPTAGSMAACINYRATCYG